MHEALVHELDLGRFLVVLRDTGCLCEFVPATARRGH